MHRHEVRPREEEAVASEVVIGQVEEVAVGVAEKPDEGEIAPEAPERRAADDPVSEALGAAGS
ncbi:MAG: hypothetical protein M3312_07805 [Actinomycetota bacterium]|nr:hypothetical protein [Actinomycetota bacterium]